MFNNRYSILIALVYFFSTNLSHAQNSIFKLTGDIITIPISLIDAYPMIAGEVNGVKGKFFFDTGLKTAIEINENVVPLDRDKMKAYRESRTGSNQIFKMSMNESINEVKLINGLKFENLKNIQSGNFQHIQNITSVDCLGYIGYDFFHGYIVKLDYLRRRLIFYKNSLEREKNKDFLADEIVVAVLDFDISNAQNHPVINARIGDLELQVSMDTGQFGCLQVTEEGKATLEKQNSLRQLSPKLVNVKDITLDNKFTTKLKGMYLITDDSFSHVKKHINIRTDNYMSIGHRLLDEFNTVWDFENKKLYLLER